MQKVVLSLILCVVAAAIFFSGYGKKETSEIKPAATADEAIAFSRTITDGQQKVAYLVKQAQAFADQNNWEDAVIVVDEGMKVDQWNTKELDELGAQAAAVILSGDHQQTPE